MVQLGKDELTLERERRSRVRSKITFVLAILLLTVPTLMIIFYHISENWFKILNTLGLLIVTFRVVGSLTTSVTISVIKAQSTELKKSNDRDVKILFILTIIIQFVNLSFVHFS